MTQEQILNILNTDTNKNHLTNIGQIHVFTKHYLLLAEELSAEGMSFLQPLKEHRDAYDHLMRIFSLPIRDCGFEDVSDYVSDNLKKAYGHEYRAFFDTVDWLTYICRKYIRETLSYKAKQKVYKKKYSELDFKNTKNIINDIPFKIAKMRENKDISSKQLDTESILKEIYEYKEILDLLLDIYKKIQSL